MNEIWSHIALIVLSSVKVCEHVLSYFSFPTLCHPMDCGPAGSSVHGILQARILEQYWHFILQGIFPTQGSNPCLLRLLHWQAGSLPLAPPGRPSVNVISPKAAQEQQPYVILSWAEWQL